MLVPYNSIPNNNSGARRKKEKISQLAQDTFQAFRPFINVYDWGLKFLESPYHLITKQDWDFYNRYMAKERGLRYENGNEFHPYHDWLKHIYSAWHVHRHIEHREMSYYTSGKNGLGLLYLDVDAHHAWQTDELRGKAVLEKFFPFGYYCASGRGQNGYLKVRYTSIWEFNQVARYVQGVLKRCFLHLGILCDIETKGTITHDGKSGSLAKLPFRTRTDVWNYTLLEKFRACPIVNARRIMEIVRRLERQIDEEKVRRFAEKKKALLEEEKNKDETKAPRQASQPPEKQAVPVAPKRVAAPELPTPSPHASVDRIRLKLPATVEKEGDAFVRNHADIRPFVRGFYREYRRLPSTGETLEWLRANGRYSGQWHDNEARRARRVGQILRFTEQGFDPSKLSDGDHKPVDLNVRKFSWWVEQKYGRAMEARFSDPRQFDPISMTAPITDISVPARFVQTFLVVADFCLKQDPLENKAVPTNRIKKIWEMVKGGAAWNQRYFQVVRDRLHRMNVIRIVDRKHRSGKAWKWEAGKNFPEDSRGEMERKLRERCRGPVGEAVSLEEFLAGTRILTKLRLHNTLYNNGEEILGFWDSSLPVRAPP